MPGTESGGGLLGAQVYLLPGDLTLRRHQGCLLTPCLGEALSPTSVRWPCHVSFASHSSPCPGKPWCVFLVELGLHRVSEAGPAPGQASLSLNRSSVLGNQARPLSARDPGAQRGHGACSGSPAAGGGQTQVGLGAAAHPEAGHEEQLEQLGGPGVVPGQLACSSAWTVASPPLGLGVGQGAPADAG